jgi:prepilin-type N-terminal cleavage/methylation domain-containing protein
MNGFTTIMGFNSTATHSAGQRGLHRGAFSLVELLVVVSIVALLIAILLPTLRTAREQAKQIACQNNLSEIALGWNTYLIENSEHFLQTINANINYGGQQGNQSAFRGPKPLNRQMGIPAIVDNGAEVFLCPKDTGSNIVRPSSFEFHGTSYDTNPFLIGQNQTNFWRNRRDPSRAVLKKVNDRLPDLILSRVTTNDSELILVGDYGWMHHWNFDSSQRIEWHKRLCHYNLAFLDGHAAFTKIKKGVHVTADYKIIPFLDLLNEAEALQEEVPCE